MLGRPALSGALVVRVEGFHETALAEVGAQLLRYLQHDVPVPTPPDQVRYLPFLGHNHAE